MCIYILSIWVCIYMYIHKGRERERERIFIFAYEAESDPEGPRRETMPLMVLGNRSRELSGLGCFRLRLKPLKG